MDASSFGVNNDKMEKLRDVYFAAHFGREEIRLCADVCEPDGYLAHAWEECVGSGTAYLYITPEKDYARQIADHLKMVRDELGFKRVYADKIIAYEPFLTTYVQDGDGNPVYRWEQTDRVIDIFLEIGVRPFVMISAMPRALASDPANVNFDGGNSSPPRDYAKWKRFCRDFVLHLIGRYGAGEVASWYFQIFNEPDIGNIYWSGTFEEFYKTYDYAATAVKEADPRIKVGPGGFAFIDGYVIAAFIDHVTSRNFDPDGDPAGAPMDFINGHGYPLPTGQTFRDAFDKLDRYMVSHYGPDHRKELIVSEWNTNADMKPSSVHDDAFNAAFAVRQVFECAGHFSDPSKTRFFSFWTHSDIFDELGDITSEFGLYGLVSKNGIKKPNFNAFKMLHRLGRSRIRLEGGSDSLNGLATYNDETVTIVLFHCVYDMRRADGDPMMDCGVNLLVRGIPWPRSRVENFRIDAAHSNAFVVWRNMGSPAECTDEQLRALKGKMDLEWIEEPFEEETGDGIFRLRTSLPMPSVTMIVITPVEREIRGRAKRFFASGQNP